MIDRKKEIVKCDGFQVNLEEIENFIESIAGVERVSVVAIPDDEFEYILSAIIVKRRGFDGLTEDDVADFVAERFAYFKHLRGGVFFVKKIPETSNGKVNKRLVTEVVVSKHLVEQSH